MKTILTFLLTAGACFGTSFSYNVLITTGLPVTLGSVELQYNPGPTITKLSTVTITQFTPLTGLGAASNAGDVTGTLQTTLTIKNTTGFNDYFNTYTIPSQARFTITFSGPGVDTPGGTSGSTFAFWLYSDAAGTMPLITPSGANPLGLLFQIDLNTAGAISNTNFSAGGTTALITAAAPEPATLALLPLGFGALALMRRRCV